MAKKSSVAEELKALGLELASAFKNARDSEEFKNLEKDIASSVRKVSASLVKSIKAANRSAQAGRIKKRVGRVVKMGSAKSKEEAQKAAKVGMHKVNRAFQTLAKKMKSGQ